MANYQYDESGVLASYFILTFLTLILLPISFSFLPSIHKVKEDGCSCSDCQSKAARIKKSRSILKPKMGIKSVTTLAGWILFAYLAHKVATTKLENTLYDPFEILGIRAGTPEKDIKRHYKKLSLKYHPDKVKLAENQTIDEVSAYYVNLTKAYKALTDEEIRSNLEKFGHPDGKQEFSMGLALPTWVVESHNNVWVLGAYALLIAGVLPMIVGRWWFGSRKFTKDGVLSPTALLFFKGIREETIPAALILLIARAWYYENTLQTKKIASLKSILELEAKIKATIGAEYGNTPSTNTHQNPEATRRALALLYAHMLRIDLQDLLLAKELEELLLSTPTFLTSMVSMSTAHNWWQTTLNIMHLQSCLVQGTFPGSNQLSAFPGVEKNDIKASDGIISSYLKNLSQKKDIRYENAKRVADNWGNLEIIDSQFKVIGERIVTPGAIVQIVLSLRVKPTTFVGNGSSRVSEPTVEERKKEVREEEENELKFLTYSKSPSDDLLPGLSLPGNAHAPYWPEDRKPSWWIILGDLKLNKVVVQPTKITEVPLANPSLSPKDFRKFKLSFQAPPNVGSYTFQLRVVSDTFVGEDASCYMTLKVEDLSALSEEEQMEEDEISDPDEDTLAGQMAAMRGEKVKRSAYYDDDDESSTDDDQSDGDDDSDSDSD